MTRNLTHTWDFQHIIGIWEKEGKKEKINTVLLNLCLLNLIEGLE